MFFEEKLKERFSRFYDITDKESIGSVTFDFVARFHQRNSKYVLKQSNEYYAFENNEFILFKKLDQPFTEETLEEVIVFFHEHAPSLPKVDDEHMSSVVKIIIETELPTDPQLIKKIQKFKYYKSFMFGLKGWIHGGLMLINPSEERGLSNKYSKKELEKFLS
jgi:hypothetical protein